MITDSCVLIIRPIQKPPGEAYKFNVLFLALQCWSTVPLPDKSRAITIKVQAIRSDDLQLSFLILFGNIIICHIGLALSKWSYASHI